jgi:exopolysaccharide production protein ExoZ
MDKRPQLLGLQAGRGIAALLVVTYHASLILAKYTGVLVGAGFFQGFGRAGVDFFFVLSGFIIYLIHVHDIGQPDAFGRYLRKRFTRVYLTYWAVLVILIPVYFINPAFGLGHERTISAIIKSFTLFPADDKGGVLILPLAWTLAHEIVFYVAFGMVILNRLIGRIVLTAWLAILVCGQLIPTPEYPFDFFLYVKNIEFFFGMLAAKLLVERRLNSSWWVAVAGICLFLANSVAETMSYSFYRSPFTLLYGMSAALIIFCLASKEMRGHQLVFLKPFSLLGDASYSVYLVHFTIISAVIKLAVVLGLICTTSAWGSFLWLVICGVCGGIAFHLLVERRILKQRLHFPAAGTRHRATARAWLSKKAHSIAFSGG